KSPTFTPEVSIAHESAATEPADTPGRRLPRIGGLIAAAGGVVMISGAITQEAFGGPLFEALEAGDTTSGTSALVEAAAHGTAHTVGIALWIVGILSMTAGGSLLVSERRSLPAAVARWALTAAAGAAVVFFSLMIGVVHGLAPAAQAGQDVGSTLLTVGFGAAVADWITTTLVLGVGFVAVAFDGRDRWAPRWLIGLATVTAVVSMVSILVFAVTGNSAIGMVEVLVGLILVIATGAIAAVRTR
ncbi:MAG: hypothetical protein OEW83_11480, partial [Acidimicrobiia bacterium]|nr:hypothetical protein [Acidimicrobiia bacterium]